MEVKWEKQDIHSEFWLGMFLEEKTWKIDHEMRG
jgi:hypothetical protein